MEFFKCILVDEAINIINEEFKDYKLESEIVDLDNAYDRVLYEDVISKEFVPEFDRSTVDGYAIVAEDSYGATDTIPTVLEIIGEVKMGEAADWVISSGKCVYVPTGGMIPKGANAVIMIENTEKMDENTLLVQKPVRIQENIIKRGEDIKEGDVVIERGRKLNPAHIGALASLGISKVQVFKKPKVFIISTGDEIIGIEDKLEFGKIRDINSYSLKAQSKKAGLEVVGNVVVKDDFAQLKEAISYGVEISDIVLLSGGSSVGERDFTKEAIKSLGGKGILAHGISIKPGKPTLIANAKGKLVVGLPGHPVSAITVFTAVVEPFIEKLYSLNTIKPTIFAQMTANFPSAPGKDTYVFVNIKKEEGKYYATPKFGKSGMITNLSKADGYIVIKIHEEGVNKGDIREVYLL